MNLVQYELFASIAQTQNISKTAKELFITQPTVSHHIKVLEQGLGVELVKRTNRGVELTAAGEEFLPYVQEILSINEQAQARMHGIAEGLTSNIRVALLSSATKIVSDCLSDFSEKSGDTQVDIAIMEGDEMIRALRKNSHDFYFAVSRMAPLGMNYEEIIVAKWQLALFMNKSLADSMDGIDWEVIAGQPFIVVPKTDTSLFNRVNTICHSHGFTPKITKINNRAETIILFVNAGMGVAILPSSLADIYQRQNVKAVTIDESDATTRLCCMWDPQKMDEAGLQFIETVRHLYGHHTEDD
ncbi:MAG: LysR family transcriptional regulator [Lachnospiraceae bacterium]|jgi:DNA-binding transcriptional LysR family regulator